MNIDSIKNYPTGSLVKHKSAYGLESRQKSTSASLYNEEKNLNREYNDGSLTRNNVAAVQFTGKLGNAFTKGLDKVLNKVNPLCDGDTVIAQNLVALILAGVFRPAAIMTLPGDKKNLKDKMYAAAQAISSGVIGFIFSTILMYPLGQGVKKFKTAVKAVNGNDLGKLSAKTVQRLKDIYKVSNLKDLEASKAFKNTTKILDMGPDVFAFGILKACLTIAMIPPILKYFGWEKSKPQSVVLAQAAKPNMANFVGGQK